MTQIVHWKCDICDATETTDNCYERPRGWNKLRLEDDISSRIYYSFHICGKCGVKADDTKGKSLLKHYWSKLRGK